MDLYDSGCLNKKEYHSYSHPSEDPYMSISGLHSPSSRLPPTIYTQSEESGTRSSLRNTDPCDFNRNQELPSVNPSNTFMGMFELLISTAGVAGDKQGNKFGGVLVLQTMLISKLLSSYNLHSLIWLKGNEVSRGR